MNADECQTEALLSPWGLWPFRAQHAPVIATWVTNETQLRWLAPSTVPPLTAEKVTAWKRPHGWAYVLSTEAGADPLGYGELNPMKNDPRHYWLGHVVISPVRRRCGLGVWLVRSLLHQAYSSLGAERVSLIVFPANEAALHCYRRAGLVEIGEEYHQFGKEGPHHRLIRFESRPPGCTGVK